MSKKREEMFVVIFFPSSLIVKKEKPSGKEKVISQFIRDQVEKYGGNPRTIMANKINITYHPYRDEWEYKVYAFKKQCELPQLKVIRHE